MVWNIYLNISKNKEKLYEKKLCLWVDCPGDVSRHYNISWVGLLFSHCARKISIILFCKTKCVLGLPLFHLPGWICMSSKIRTSFILLSTPPHWKPPNETENRSPYFKWEVNGKRFVFFYKKTKRREKILYPPEHFALKFQIHYKWDARLWNHLWQPSFFLNWFLRLSQKCETLIKASNNSQARNIGGKEDLATLTQNRKGCLYQNTLQ